MSHLDAVIDPCGALLNASFFIVMVITGKQI